MRALTFVCATHSIFCSPAAVKRSCKAAISDTSSEEVMPIKVGINGFGRIGRNIMRTALDDRDIQFVAVNDVTDAKTLAHLLKYDSVLGNLPHTVTHTEDTIAVQGKSFKVFKTKDPARSEEHTSELQSQSNLVCRLLLEKKKNTHNPTTLHYTTITVR